MELCLGVQDADDTVRLYTAGGNSARGLRSCFSS